MANEHLQRLPTAYGNRSTYTWSGWIKRNKLSSWERLFSVAGQTMLQLCGGSSPDQLRYFHQTSGNFDLRTDALLRDVGSWMHIVYSVDHTREHSKNRVRIYINGAEVDNYATDSSSNGSQNMETFFNSLTEHALLGRETTNAGENFQGEAFDIFWVDGQALTADVFGYYKDGDGYQSSGTDRTTDFRSGQWSPRLPKSIKHTINRGGGFGVNGFYIPLNDSSNPGADFHCTPNTIVKLKGEDSPQPRNGAPTTSDAFVSQLREEKGTLGFDGAVKFDGSDDYLEIPHSDDFDFGSGDFTVEAFIEGARGGTRTGSVVLNQSNGSAASDSAFYFGAGTNGVSLYLTTGTGWNSYINTDVSVSNSGWHHVVWQRRSNTLEIYVDGRLAQTGSFTGTVNNSSRAVEVGRQSTDGSNFNGMISNLRVVKGTAVYTANFTPPTEPLTNVNNTKLLCCNSSTSATAATVIPSGSITANGGAFATRNELSGYIVLAVPFISRLIGSNKITNGSFDIVSDGQDGYDNGNGTVDGWTNNVNSSLSITGNALRITHLTSGSWQGGNAYYVMGSNFVVGKTYCLKYRIRSSGNGNYSQGVGSRIQKGSSAHSSNTAYSRSSSSDPGTSWKTVQWTWKAEQTSYTVEFFNWYGVQNSWLEIADLGVYEQDTIRDYSADIRGSGTNKTVDVKNEFDVVDCPSHYGSALQCNPANGSYAEVAANAEFANLWDVDHTIEFWYKNDAWDGSYYPHAELIGLRHSTSNVAWRIAFTDKNSVNEDGIQLFGTNAFNTGANSLNNDWNHCAVEQYTSNGVIKVTIYVNGIRTAENTGPVGYAAYKDSTGPIIIGTDPRSAALGDTYSFNGQIQDVRIYKGIAKYRGGFDVPKPYTPIGIDESFRTTADTSKNNFPTLNPLAAQGTFSNGNLSFAPATGVAYSGAISNFMVSSGKWYCEFRCDNEAGGTIIPGIYELENKGFRDVFGGSNFFGQSVEADETAGARFDLVADDGDIVSLYMDLDSSPITCSISVNGGNATTYSSDSLTQNYNNLIPGRTYGFGAADAQSGTVGIQFTFNFGQNPTFCGQVTAGTNTDSNGKGLFKYAPPTGFLALCDDNLPTPAVADPGKHFKTVLWVGNGTSGHSISKVGFKPDLVWIFNRDRATYKPVFDSVRGATNMLRSNQTNAQGTFDSVLQSFDSDGFTVGGDGAHNYSGERVSAWCWKAGGMPIVNTDGSASSLVSANQEAGFSIVKFTAQTSGSITLGHGLGKKPAFWIWKDISGTTGWYVYHQRMGASAWLQFDAALATTGNSAAWGSDPTDTVFTHGWGFANQNDIIMYIWAEIDGYSKFGNYIGNNSDNGPYVYCGFKPAWVLIKKIDGSGDENWRLFDSSRCPTNQNDKHAVISSTGLESTESGIDLLSNGFKVRHSDGHQNQSGSEYIFAAFAESPFQTANAK